ncbi:MAG: PDDEXK nuclease domain-containing protein [Streptococcaceae bacterium]|jgi:predicted nuclease of restriction endonuclease-like (RecB) superfamily|nr:PDDEXK nuclease domain-containing protein [Streptococcaceae bacterium]
MNQKNMLFDGKEYLDLVETIKKRVRKTQYEVARQANAELIMMYWSIGRLINEHNDWGKSFVENLSKDIQAEFPKIVGFSRRNLFNMAKFAALYPDEKFVQPVVAQIPWTHNMILIEKVSDEKQRLWYIDQVKKNNWSKRELQHQIETDVFHRQTSIEKTTNFDVTLENPQNSLAQDLIKDPYVFDFVAVRKVALERVIENELVQNVTKFLLELGSGFSFVGQQYPIHVGDNDFYLDLLFYHLELRCYVVVELKAVDFKPEFAGKLNFYVNAVDGEIRREGDNPTIGILLCKNKDRLMAEYALKNIHSPIGVAEYSLTEVLPDEYVNKIPSVEDIEARLLKDFNIADEEE